MTDYQGIGHLMMQHDVDEAVDETKPQNGKLTFRKDEYVNGLIDLELTAELIALESIIQAIEQKSDVPAHLDSPAVRVYINRFIQRIRKKQSGLKSDLKAERQQRVNVLLTASTAPDEDSTYPAWLDQITGDES